MKKRFIIILTVFLMLCMSISLVGCKKTGPIPNGCYAVAQSIPENPLPANSFVFTESDIRDSFGWVIKGDTAEEWVSSLCNYKAKIVEKEGEIYFEGYTWSDPLDVLFGDSKKRGNTDVYQVVYNESTRSISLALVAFPHGD
ncbi:MAG: hypothetical protein IKD47_04555 [Clostridia bacterium]|nr:hypothetical protein [Clostridia bacterium]